MNGRLFFIGALLAWAYIPFALGADLAARLELYKEQVLVGEPLVVTAVVANQGKEPVVSTFAVPRWFQRYAMADFVIREAKQGTVVARASWDRSVGVEDPPKSLAGDRLKEYSVMPGKGVKRLRLLPMLTERGTYLAPGEYTIEAAIDFPPVQSVAAAKTPFTIQPLAKGDEEIPKILTPQEAWVLPMLERTPESLPKLRLLRDKLRNSFPKAPHRLYYEYALLRQPIEADEKTYRTAVNQYFKDHPKSPFLPELLYRRGKFELFPRDVAAGVADLKKLFDEYPDSPYTGDARALLERCGFEEAEELLESLESNLEQAK